ncbi:MAG: sulfotransferase [Rhodospirillales bacterium]|nr:sulfotransferase [Rhodospirillales bacterium]
MGIPTFIVVGAQKAGTTWLYECLSEHPEAFVPRMKEVHFFSRPEDDRMSRLEKGIDWYKSLFPDQGYLATGDVTPDYMFQPYVAEAIHALNPKMKIVALLREPVARAHSAYWMRRRYDPKPLPFAEAIKVSPALIERGYYHRQLVPYLSRFGAENVRIYIYEEATAEPEAFFADLARFLGISPAFVPLSLRQRVGETKVLPPPFGFIFYKVLSPVINLPGILAAWRWLRRRTRIKEWLFGKLARGGDGSSYARLPKEEAEKLKLHFAEENRKLFELLGRDIPAWKA